MAGRTASPERPVFIDDRALADGGSDAERTAGTRMQVILGKRIKSGRVFQTRVSTPMMITVTFEPVSTGAKPETNVPH